MLIEAPVLDGRRVTVALAMEDGTGAELNWRLPDEPEHVPADLAFPPALLLAMRRREPLAMASPVSPRMLGAAPAVQDILSSWSRLEGLELAEPPLFEPVSVRAPAALAAAGRGEGVACFFSGGADSFYSVLRHRDELTALVYVYGFDVPLDDARLRATVAKGVRSAAAELGLPLLEVESDVRALSDPHVSWDDFFGAAMASVAHLLADRFRRIYLPASLTYATLLPLGSHPLVDPLWSSERIELVHDGAGATRNEKLAAIAESEVARRWLRVCWQNLDGAYNCGRCGKCLRTLVGLRLAGVVDRFESFPRLDLEAVASMPLEYGGWGWRESLDVIERAGTDPDLTAALRTALRRVRLVAAERDRSTRGITDTRRDALELLELATETAVERDGLQARNEELEGRLADVRATRTWRAAMWWWRVRARLRKWRNASAWDGALR